MRLVSRCSNCGSTYFTMDGAGNTRCRHCGYVEVKAPIPKLGYNCILDMINSTLEELGEVEESEILSVPFPDDITVQPPPASLPKYTSEVERDYLKGKQMTFTCSNPDCVRHLAFDPMKVRLKDVPRTCTCGSMMILGRDK